MSKIIKTFISLFILVGALYFLDVAEIINQLKNINISTIVGGVLLLLIGYIFIALRWKNLIEEYVKPSHFENIALFFYTNFYNSFSPANLGGDAFRVMVFRKKISYKNIFILLIQERAIGLIAYLMCFLIGASCLFLQLTPILISCFVLALLFFGLLFLLYFLVPFLKQFLKFKILKDLAEAFSKTMDLLLSKKSPLLFFYTILTIILWVLVVAFVAQGLEIKLTIFHFLIIATLGEIIRMIPISFQGIGVREAVFAFLLSQFGYGYEQGFSLGLISYLLISLSLLICGFIAFIMSFKNPKIKHS